MKSGPGPNGNANLRGRKSFTFRCGCCDAWDLREEYSKRLAEREMRDWQANDDMVEGYKDGFDLDAPEPSANRSASYRHGFANGRDDRRGKVRASWQEIDRQGRAAIAADAAR
jgi:hypothetical protein